MHPSSNPLSDNEGVSLCSACFILLVGIDTLSALFPAEAWEVNGVNRAGMQKDYHLTLTQRRRSNQTIRSHVFWSLLHLQCLWGYNVYAKARYSARQRAGRWEEAGLELHRVGRKWRCQHRCGRRTDANGPGAFWAQRVSDQQPGHNAHRFHTDTVQAETFIPGGHRRLGSTFLPVWPAGPRPNLHLSHLEEDEEHPAFSDGYLGSCQDGEHSGGAFLGRHAVPHNPPVPSTQSQISPSSQPPLWWRDVSRSSAHFILRPSENQIT